MTDYFANKMPGAVVCRFNGGAQAGHTVVTPEGVRHVFGHIGSGSFCGNPTHLSEYFISNPVLFQKEYLELQSKLEVIPHISVDPNSIVTTPYDMIINQMVEQLRYAKKHGSCGCGINETVERNKNSKLTLRVKDLYNPFKLNRILKTVSSREYFKERINENGIVKNATIPSEYETLLLNPNIISTFEKNINFFINKIEVIKDTLALSNKDIIFEGAQGLLLDQDFKDYWPYVTSSKTGLANVLRITGQLGKEINEIVYVTRSYLTRHGNGPLPNEIPREAIKCPDPIDLTNIINKHQGSIRFGSINPGFLRETILNDAGGYGTRAFLAITHMDQNIINLPRAKYISRGPTRKDITNMPKWLSGQKQ
jgi:adenylosuccinate synthase